MCSFLHSRLNQPTLMIVKVYNTFFCPLVSLTFHSNSAHFVSHYKETVTQLNHLTFVTLWLLKSGTQIPQCFSYLYLQPTKDGHHEDIVVMEWLRWFHKIYLLSYPEPLDPTHLFSEPGKFQFQTHCLQEPMQTMLQLTHWALGY